MASKRPARATKSKPTKPADIRVPVDATLEKRWDELKKVIDPALKDVRVRVRNGLVTFTSVPAGGMEAFRATLAKVSWTKA